MFAQDREKYGFQFDEEGANEVSAQIMDAYSSGVIEQAENKHESRQNGEQSEYQ